MAALDSAEDATGTPQLLNQQMRELLGPTHRYPDIATGLFAALD
jgi:hypothetical protein